MHSGWFQRKSHAMVGQLTPVVLFSGTQREYSSKPLKYSIVKCILVFKR